MVENFDIGFENFLTRYKNMTADYIPEWIFTSDYSNYSPFVMSTIGSILVGLSGVMPLFIIPIDQTVNLKQGAGANTLRVLLSFAVGGLLGDVFLHLLPEAWANDARNGHDGHPSLYSGLLVLLGLIVFVAAEKLFSGVAVQEDKEIDVRTNNNSKGSHAAENSTNGFARVPNGIKLAEPAAEPRQVAGYLNLLANSIDNFTHGLAVGGSFLVSLRLGAFTTCAILIHEIPHEVGDFAILLRSGFSRWDAAVGQVVTAGAGLVGSLVAVSCSGAEAQTSWILPFTAGGFLHIALVSVLPELLQEESPKESLKQLGSLLLGIAVMAALSALE